MAMIILLGLLASSPPETAWVRVVQPPLPTQIELTTSWYESGSLTASGEPFDPEELTAAHPTLKFGTTLLLRNPQNSLTVTVRVNDRGPYTEGRDLDISRAAAEQLGMLDQGIQTLYWIK